MNSYQTKINQFIPISNAHLLVDAVFRMKDSILDWSSEFGISISLRLFAVNHWGDFGVFLKSVFKDIWEAMFWFFKHWFLFWFFMAMKWFQLKIEKYLIQRLGDVSWSHVSCIAKLILFLSENYSKKSFNEKRLHRLTMRSHFQAKKSIGTKKRHFLLKNTFLNEKYIPFPNIVCAEK